MADYLIQGGQKFNAASEADVRRIVREESIAQREKLRGIKVMDLPIMSGKVASSAITLGPNYGQVCGPESGYAWLVMAIVVTGLTSGGSPDVLNLYKNDVTRPIWWQFNGNNFGYTWGKGQRVLYTGESLAAQNSGTLAATGIIAITGTVIEAPSERIGELVA